MKKYTCRYIELAEIKFDVAANNAKEAAAIGQDMVDDGRIDLTALYPLDHTIYVDEPGRMEAQPDYEARKELVDRLGGNFKRYAKHLSIRRNGKTFIVVDRFGKIIDIVVPAATLTIEGAYLERAIFPEDAVVGDYFEEKIGSDDNLVGTWFARKHASLEELEAALTEETEAEKC